MQNTPSEFQRGYAEAAMVIDSCFTPGYCRNIEESHRLATSMLSDGISAKDAVYRRGEFLEAIRAKDRGIDAATIKRQGDTTGSIVRPSASMSQRESSGEIFERWAKEMGGEQKQEAVPGQ